MKTNFAAGGLSEYVVQSYSNGFKEVNRHFIEIFGMDKSGVISDNPDKVIFNTNVGFMVMRFIAFAYTYHYLNWFSKTSFIKWHEVPKARLITISALWLASIALYAYSYEVGLKFLFFLSFLHVFLEFPLNFKTIMGLGREIGTRVGVVKPMPVGNKQ